MVYWNLDRTEHFATILHKLSKAPIASLREDPSYSTAIEAAYDFGFVQSEIDINGAPAEVFERAITEPGLINRWLPRDALYFFHYMFRAERHSDAGDAQGGGIIAASIRAGALEAASNWLKKFNAAR